jgi:peptide/nickel transport system ATP-binding protein
MDGPLLDVSGLTVAFRLDRTWRTAVDGLSFQLADRETLAIVGESGSGKSVTALSIMGLVPKVNSRIDGSARLQGRDLISLPEDALRTVRGRDIAMIFQEPMTSLNPVLTIGFQVSEALRYHRGMDHAAARAETLRVLDRVKLPSAQRRFDDYPHRFSGGMRQRVMIAMALCCRPRVLIADEPTTALDVTVQAEILDLVRTLQQEEGMAVLFITHDMGVVAEIADRVLVMWKGAKVEEGRTAPLFAAPRHPYTRSLLGAVPVLGSMRGRPAPEKLPTIDPLTGIAEKAGPPPAPPAGDRGKVLEVQGLTTRFPIRSGLLRRVVGHVHAVEDVSFNLDSGETLALVGESGCGKSTTGRSILRLVEPDRGVMRFEGADLRAADRAGLMALRRRMQMIFQDPYGSLSPRRTVGQSIAEPLLVHGLAHRNEVGERIATLLRRVGLAPEMADRLPHEFSGGQRQRVCIARALALAPKLIIADEAVSALDVSIKAQILNLMMDLQSELGLSYLFISHDIAVVERISHRIAVMLRGEIVEIGPRAAIMENPQHPYTRKLIAAVPVPDPAVRGRRRASIDVAALDQVRPAGRAEAARSWRTVEPGHLVQEPQPS